MGETSEQASKEKWNEMANKKVCVLSLFHFTLLYFASIVSFHLDGRLCLCSVSSVSSLSASVRASNLLARLMSFWYEVEIGNARNVGGKSARFNSNALCFQHSFSGSADEAILIYNKTVVKGGKHGELEWKELFYFFPSNMKLARQV